MMSLGAARMSSHLQNRELQILKTDHLIKWSGRHLLGIPLTMVMELALPRHWTGVGTVCLRRFECAPKDQDIVHCAGRIGTPLR
jgi:hypothetical protein